MSSSAKCHRIYGLEIWIIFLYNPDGLVPWFYSTKRHSQLLTIESRHTGQFNSGEEFQRGSAAGRNVRDLGGNSRRLNRLLGIAAAHHADGTGFRHSFGQRHGTFVERRFLEN